MNFTGKITVISSLEEVGEAKTKKQTIILESEDKNQIAIDFLGENLKQLEGIQAGDAVTVEYSCKVNIQGRFFNRISGKSITKIEVE